MIVLFNFRIFSCDILFVSYFLVLTYLQCRHLLCLLQVPISLIVTMFTSVRPKIINTFLYFLGINYSMHKSSTMFVISCDERTY